MKGLLTIYQKEIADHFNSWRFIILFAIVVVVGVIAIYVDARFIRQAVVDPRFVFLQLYTTSGQSLPLFIFFITFFMPIVGIILGFDVINSEKNNGTMGRLISQPIYRDAVINGKFLAGVVTIAIMLTSMVLLVGGMGLRMIGVPPTAEEATRLLAFLIMGIFYGAFWLGLAILFSIFFQKVATSALASVAVWLLSIFLFIVPFFLNTGEVGITIMQISPITLFWQITVVLLIPTSRPLGMLLSSGSDSVPTSALSLSQSMLTVWPYLVVIIGLTLVCFAISYAKFMREEIRST